MGNRQLAQRDRAVIWHPCTQMKDHECQAAIPIRCGQGVWLEDFDGKRYLDAISSWWVNLFGHANPYINAAIRGQLERLEHVLLAGFTHEPAVCLAERLVELAPVGLSRCFYADNGSSAVEVALKMSFHYWRNSGQLQKTRFITLENSYHGETLGALAVGDVSHPPEPGSGTGRAVRSARDRAASRAAAARKPPAASCRGPGGLESRNFARKRDRDAADCCRRRLAHRRRDRRRERVRPSGKTACPPDAAQRRPGSWPAPRRGNGFGIDQP